MPNIDFWSTVDFGWLFFEEKRYFWHGAKLGYDTKQNSFFSHLKGMTPWALHRRMAKTITLS
jgi:hypothetical protein